jgi:hypothetical protein
MPDTIKDADEAKYIKGFNEGYLLTEYLPDLSEKLATLKAEGPQLRGFRDGREEFLNEKDKTKETEKETEKGTDLNREPSPGWMQSSVLSRFLLSRDEGPEKGAGKEAEKPKPRRDRGFEPER